MSPEARAPRRKSKEVVGTTLECIAPGQSNELLALVVNPTPIEPEPVTTLWRPCFHFTKARHLGIQK